jgi:predicted nucleic acid-binding Zn finger protein
LSNTWYYIIFKYTYYAIVLSSNTFKYSSIPSITTMKQTVSKLEKKNRREGRGRVLALSRRIYRLQGGKDTYHVESESCDSRYYFVRYNPSVFEWCSCKDFENSRTEGRCKHLYAVEFAIRFATVKEVEHFPQESIRTLNDLEKAEIEAEEYRTRRILTYESDDYSF